MTQQSEKILLIGLDGATWDILDPMMARGLLPNLTALKEQGRHAVLRSINPPVTAAAWSSFMTGKQPDKHRIFDFQALPSAHPEHVEGVESTTLLTNGSDIRGAGIWQILSHHQKRIISIGMPYTYPVYPVNGVLISGFDTPSSDSDYCFPPELKPILRSRVPNFSPALKPWSMEDVRRSADAVAYVEQLIAYMDARTEVLLKLWYEEDWDVSFIQFQEVDFIQHVLWDEIVAVAGSSPSTSSGQAENHTPLAAAVERFYARVDYHVGHLLQQAQEATDQLQCLVLSDHGFGKHEGSIYPRHYLREWGLEEIEASSGSDSFLKSIQTRLRTMAYGNDNRVVGRVYVLAKSLAKRLKRTSGVTVHDQLQDKAGTPVETTRNRVELIGDLQAIFRVRDLEEIPLLIEKLQQLRFTDTGTPIFQSVQRVGNLYNRSQITEEDAHLVIAIPQPGYSISSGLVGAPYFHRPVGQYPGTHRMEGILIAAGSGVAGQGDFGKLNLIDIAPTLLHMLDLPVPEDMDGQIHHSLLTVQREPQFAKPLEVDKMQREMSADDEEMLVERLKSLGYLG